MQLLIKAAVMGCIILKNVNNENFYIDLNDLMSEDIEVAAQVRDRIVDAVSVIRMKKSYKKGEIIQICLKSDYCFTNSSNLKYATTADNIKTIINSGSILYSFFVM